MKKLPSSLALIISFVLSGCALAGNDRPTASESSPSTVIAWPHPVLLQGTQQQPSHDIWMATTTSHVPNNELERYAPSAVQKIGSSLIIRSDDVRGTYVSGSVISKHSYLYGMYQFVAKLPSGNGVFPAIWMDTLNHLYPEIDIMESVWTQPGFDYPVCHFQVNGSRHERVWTQVEVPDMYTRYHIYALDWEPNRLVWYVDGQPVLMQDHNVPNVPMYIRINTAIGGNWPKAPVGTKFPQYFNIKSFAYVPYKEK